MQTNVEYYERQRLYDGVGRPKMGGANYGDRKMTAVKTGVIMSGQEIPTADIALFHRCIFLPFLRSEFTLEERKRFADLRAIQEKGLAGKRVAICVQIEVPKAKTLVKRGITDWVSGAEQPAEPAAPKRRGRKPKAEQSDMTFNDESAA